MSLTREDAVKKVNEDLKALQKDKNLQNELVQKAQKSGNIKLFEGAIAANKAHMAQLTQEICELDQLIGQSISPNDPEFTNFRII